MQGDATLRAPWAKVNPWDGQNTSIPETLLEASVVVHEIEMIFLITLKGFFRPLWSAMWSAVTLLFWVFLTSRKSRGQSRA